MKIAIINLITQTVNSSPNILNTVSFPKPYAESDEEINIVELGKELSKNGQDVTIYASDAFRPANSMINKIFRLSVIYLPTGFTRLFPYSYFLHIIWRASQ